MLYKLLAVVGDITSPDDIPDGTAGGLESIQTYLEDPTFSFFFYCTIILFAILLIISFHKLYKFATIDTQKTLSKEEQKLINNFRAIPFEKRPQACDYVRNLANENKNA